MDLPRGTAGNKILRGLWLLLDLIVAYVLIVIIGFFLIGFLLDLFDDYPENILYNFGNLISIFAGIAYLISKYKINLSIFWFNKKNITKIAIWGAIGGLIIGLANLPYGVLSGETEIPAKYYVDPIDGVGFSIIYLFIVVGLIPIAEEFFFRGLVYRIVKTKLDIFWGVLASTILFWISHNFHVSVIFSSLIYCFVYEKTNTVGTSIFAHLIRNMLWYSTIYYRAAL